MTSDRPDHKKTDFKFFYKGEEEEIPFEGIKTHESIQNSIESQKEPERFKKTAHSFAYGHNKDLNVGELSSHFNQSKPS